MIKQQYNIDLELIASGKVRDIYNIDNDHMLIVTSDRLSAFDVVLPTLIPGKGEVLTKISNFWFDYTKNIIPNHLTDLYVSSFIKNRALLMELLPRSIIVKKLKPLPIESIVRGYIVGSGWKEYQKNQSICSIKLNSGLELAEKLSEPIYTPSTKADIGYHDENISYDETIKLVGLELAKQVRDISLKLYSIAHKHALNKGIIIADTKFEFGLDQDGKLHLIDEVLTPDSSRFWPAKFYKTGNNPPSFDKQFVRDYLEDIEWNKQEPGPELPSDIVSMTSEKYKEAMKTLIN